MVEEQQTNSTNTYEYLVLDTIRRMRDAHAERNKKKYFSYFNFAMRLLLPHIDIKIREKINEDYITLNRERSKILNDKSLSDITKNIQIEDIECEFADALNSHIFIALSKVGIIRVSEEGIIDFNSIELDKIAQIVQDRSRGLEKAVENAIKS